MKKNNGMSIVVIAIATFLLALLYSPRGSLGNYTDNSFYGLNQGENFIGKIENTSEKRIGGHYTTSNFSLPRGSLRSASIRISQHLSDGGSNQIHSGQLATYSVFDRDNSNRIARVDVNNLRYSVAEQNNNIVYSANHIESSNKSDLNPSYVLNLQASLTTFTNQEEYSRRRYNSNQHGFITLTTELSSNTNADATLENIGSGLKRVNGDPGGEPTGDPIPVGDGFWFLFIIIVGYAGWKIKY